MFMDNRIQEIKKIEVMIKDAVLDADSHYKTLGELIFQNENGEYNSIIKKKKYGSSITELKKAESLLEEAESKKEKLNQFRKKVSEVIGEIRQTTEKNSDIERDNSKHFLGIADTLFNLYKKNPASMPEFENYFTGIIDLDKKNRELEKKIEDINAKKNQSVLTRIAGAGEKAILSSRKKMNDAQIISAKKKAGKEMCLNRVYENNSSQEISGMFAAYRSNRKIQEDLEIKLETLEAKKNNIEHEIDELLIYFENDPEQFLKYRLKEREEILKELGKKIYRIIFDFEKSPEKSENQESPDKTEFLINPESEGAGIFEGIKIRNSEIEKLEIKKEQLQIELEIEKIEINAAEKQKNISKKAQKINILQKEISDLETLIKEDRTRIDELKKMQRTP